MTMRRGLSIYSVVKRSLFARRLMHDAVCFVERLILRGYKDPQVVRMIRETNRKTEMWVTADEAAIIASMARAQARLPGAMAEVGVYKGGTARLICEEKGDSELHLFDTFCGIPTVDEEDEGYFDDGMFSSELAAVRELLSDYRNLQFHPGLFPGTGEAVSDKTFSFVFVDVDTYSSTRDAVSFFYPRMVDGGVLLSHDYQYPGVRRAFEDSGHGHSVIELADSLCMLIKR